MRAEVYIQHAVDFANKLNPIWPFAAVIIDKNGEILCKATDCAHISPLYHAESLAIHELIKRKGNMDLGSLSLFSTAEPDALSQSAIHWANIVHDLQIEEVYFGSSLKTIQDLWPFGIEIDAQEIINRSSGRKIKVIGAVLENECNTLFLDAKQKQQELNKDHPARGVLSYNVQDFYKINT